ncbi:hypothetical protein BV22DRAFT_1037294 [Leucogyrophana mollusca]|uniref:Uncharacterized protein n=1 Tax=Leucogyrophana mollusca TaxID=85980 RepID=A0ACB8BAX9_9AGAM|nr:hypothetical protein BV22DRAFT_1037294 [Leucogyrophana mollusca]
MSATNEHVNSLDQTSSTAAGHPFDHPSADIILRSSDDVDFRVLKSFLSLASPVFRDMFTIPQPHPPRESDIKDGLPVVQLTETRTVLEKILLICYPSYFGGVRGLTRLDEWERVAEVAGKYQMEAAMQHIFAELNKSTFTKSDPVRVFALAVRFQMPHVARSAAKYSLSLPLARHSYFPGLKDISGADLHHLLQYHLDCGEAASQALRSWHIRNSDNQTWAWYSCKNLKARPCCSQAGVLGGLSTSWWATYAKETYDALRERPSRQTVESGDLAATAINQASSCPGCSKKAPSNMARFRALIVEEIDKAVLGIKLKLEFEDNDGSAT